jgi:hypothetical protein
LSTAAQNDDVGHETLLKSELESIGFAVDHDTPLYVKALPELLTAMQNDIEAQETLVSAGPSDSISAWTDHVIPS